MTGWHAMAQDSLNAAVELRASRRWRSALNRAYFAGYARCVSALIEAGVTMPARGNPAHRDVPPMLQQHLGNLSEGKRAHLAGVMGRLYKLRLLADYEPAGSMSHDQDRIALGMAAEVFREVPEEA